ncbi:hypothetical protein AAL_07627 [Moelleriella libera RCEF 2490]|uniref:Xylitol dehydrogenase n=1 Tax=Moelleriella libera RCEF 2490 TaxID=1081109 RepID=A0A167X7P5_9HYPO|nr:hypothetical protein AAL_07627 [Moelleriella libera RCEF 2490]
MTDFMEKIKKTFSGGSSSNSHRHETRPEIPLAHPESRSNSVSASPEDIRSEPRVHFKGWGASSSSSTEPCANHNVRDAAHSPPSVLSQHLGPPVIEHKYPQDSKWRRHSISAQEQHYLRSSHD